MQTQTQTQTHESPVKTKRDRTVFRVCATFDGAENPQVIVEGTYSAAAAIDAAREWAFCADAVQAEQYFGIRSINDAGKTVRTDRERLFARALNGGSVLIQCGSFILDGSFVSYVPAR